MFCCHISWARYWPRLAAMVTASCAVSNRESRYPRHDSFSRPEARGTVIVFFQTKKKTNIQKRKKKPEACGDGKLKCALP